MKRVGIIITLSIIVTVAGLSCKRGPTQQQASGLATTTASPAALKLVDYITDNAKVIDEASKKELETTLAAFEVRKHIDFAVVTVKTTGNQSAFDYSLALARERKANSTGDNVSGLLLLVAVDDRNWHIQISNNLQDDLTKEILTNLSTPMTDAFRQNRYGEGIVKYVKAVIAEVDGRS